MNAKLGRMVCGAGIKRNAEGSGVRIGVNTIRVSGWEQEASWFLKVPP